MRSNATRAGLFALLTALAAPPAAALEIGVMQGSFYTPGVATYLATLPDVNVSTFGSCGLGQIGQFDAIVVYGNGCWDDGAFDQYVDGGGGIVATPWTMNNQGYDHPYLPYFISSSNADFGSPLLYTVADPGDFMLDGVSFQQGDSVGRENGTGVTIRQGATVPVTHSDGDPLAAYWEYGLGRAVYLNLHYVTSDCDLATAYDWGNILLGNAAVWAAGVDPCDGVDLDGDGWTDCDDDCDDQDPAIHPGAEEICDDGIDQNCDGATDEYADDDGDGYSNCDGDCDDGDPLAFPGGVEVCDFSDNDCDGWVDDGFDQDADGHTECEGDCDEADPLVFPGAAEVCNGYDDDCDGDDDDETAAYHEGG